MKLNQVAIFSLFVFCLACIRQNNSAIAITNSSDPVKKDLIGETVSILDSSIWTIFQDKNNNYWFGSNGQGLYRYDGKIIRRFTTKDGLLDNEIRGMQEDKVGNVFITSMAGINKFDGQKFTTLPAIESNEWILNPDDLWFSILGKKGENGVYRYDGNSLYHLKFPKHYLEDDFYAKYPKASFSPYEVYSIYKDRKGNMWFGTANFGVCRFDGEALSWLYEDHLTNTPNGGSFGIRSVFEDSKGDFWICNTHYRYKIEPTYTTKNGTNFIDYERKPGMGKLNNADYSYFFSMT